MAKVNLEPLRDIAGFMAAALVDSESGLLLAGDGAQVDLEAAAASNAEVIRAKRKVIESLNLSDSTEDILISLSGQYHLLRPLECDPKLFLYLVLDRTKANLAMARHELRLYERTLGLA
jgi:predicted regulator of Ras-like GTPase activity (Roadblock/LC7/MglB family)